MLERQTDGGINGERKWDKEGSGAVTFEWMDGWMDTSWAKKNKQNGASATV